MIASGDTIDQENLLGEAEKIAIEIADFGKRLYERKYICATEGNLSARLSDGRIMITPTDFNKGNLKPSDMVICDADSKRGDGAPVQSSEFRLHLVVYEKRPEIGAVCHAHPVYATAFSVARVSLNKAVLPEIVSALGAIPLVAYAPPGSRELGENLKRHVNRYDAFLLEAHGVVTIGRSCEEAFNRMEMVERFAHILYIAEQIGELKLLTSKETLRLLEEAGRLAIKTEIICGRRARRHK